MPMAGITVPTPPGAGVPLSPDDLPGAVGTGVGKLPVSVAAVGLAAPPVFVFVIDVGAIPVLLGALLPLSHPTDTKAVKSESSTATSISFFEIMFNSVTFLPENNYSCEIGFPVRDFFGRNPAYFNTIRGDGQTLPQPALVCYNHLIEY